MTIGYQFLSSPRAVLCRRSPVSCVMLASLVHSFLIGRWNAYAGMVPVQCCLASGCVFPWLGPLALRALVGEWTPTKPLVCIVGLSAGFKGHFTAQGAFGQMCVTGHRNAPRWVPSVAKRCLMGRVLRRDSEYWVCPCRRWQWIPTRLQSRVSSRKMRQGSR